MPHRFDVGGHLQHFPDFIQNETRQHRGRKEPPQPAPRQAGMCAGCGDPIVSGRIVPEMVLWCVVVLRSHLLFLLSRPIFFIHTRTLHLNGCRHASCAGRNDLVVVAVNNQRRHVELFEIFGEIRLRLTGQK